MQITLTRDSIIGVGKIETLGKQMRGEGSRSGLVSQPAIRKTGETVNVTEEIGNRLIALGSATPATAK